MDPEWIELQEPDFEVVKEIYDYYVLHTTATFSTEKIPLEELKVSIPSGHPKYKSFIIKYNGVVCGFCYYGQYRKREAYDRTAEISVYLKPEFTGKGIGKQTIEKLKIIAKEHGICVLLAVITEENRHSIRLFEKCGFEKCAHFRKVGEKFDRILDVVALQIILTE